MEKRIFIVGDPDNYEKLLRRVFPSAVISTLIGEYGDPELDKDSLVVFTDGPDLDPYLYAQQRAEGVTFSSDRDTYDLWVYNKAFIAGAQCLGIDRGSLFLWVCNRGHLVQRCDGHNASHRVCNGLTGEVVEVNSYHRQCVLTGTTKGTILAVDEGLSTLHTFWSPLSNSIQRKWATVSQPLTVVEAWYGCTETKSSLLGIQWRPDLPSCPVSGVRLFYEYVEVFLKD